MQTTLHAFKLSAPYRCCLHYGLTLYTKNYKCFNKYQTTSFEFYVSLTVHVGIILVKNQLDPLYSMYLLFHLSACFEHLVLIIRRV
jgi:hypothetical protein